MNTLNHVENEPARAVLAGGWPNRDDCQPLARLEDGCYRPACMCGWTDRQTFPNRTDALIEAYRHDSQEVAA